MLADLGLMDNERLEEVLDEVTELIDSRPGRWVVRHAGRRLIVITDEGRDRMRVMAPVVRYQQLRPRDLRVLLAANFDRSLDARYATGGGYLWAVFLHPLSQLSPTMVSEALHQVSALADNYGGSYAASDLVFTGGRQ